MRAAAARKWWALRRRGRGPSCIQASRVARGSRIQASRDGTTTLVCWRHKQLPALVQALGAELPHAKWPDHEYGWLLRFEYGADGELAAFDASSEQLMYGDGREPGEPGHGH